MFQILRLDHLVLRARDPERLIAFYTQVLGCSVERELASLGLTQLRAGDSLIDIVAAAGELGQMNGGEPDPDRRNLDHFCLRISPFDEATVRAHLAAHDVEGSEVRMVYGADGTGPSIYLNDPEGNTVELKGQPTKAPLNS
ncbi:MAG: VOC family protein [Proteobacteria bacterium]|nr:VOC family protein [Pseudomonadota bacterium]